MVNSTLNPSSWVARDVLTFLRKTVFDDITYFTEPNEEEQPALLQASEKLVENTRVLLDPPDGDEGYDRWPSAEAIGDYPLPVEKLEKLLQRAIGADHLGRRTFPSAGAMYSVSLRVAIFETDVVAKVYGFEASSGKLLPPRLMDGRALRKAVLGIEEPRFGIGTAILFFVVDLERALEKYKHRGLLFAMMDVGAMYQNILRDAQAYGITSRVWGGFSPFRVMQILGLNPSITPVVLTQLLGALK